MPSDRQRELPISRGMPRFRGVGRAALGRPRGLSTLTVFGMEGPSGALISLGMARERHAERASPLALPHKLSISTAPEPGGGIKSERRAYLSRPSNSCRSPRAFSVLARGRSSSCEAAKESRHPYLSIARAMEASPIPHLAIDIDIPRQP